MQVGEISVGVTGDITSLKTVLSQATSEVERTATTMNQKFNSIDPGSKMAPGIKNLQGFLGKLGIAATAAGTALAAMRFSAESIRVGMDFEHTMVKVKAITGATTEEFKALNEAARAIGRTTEFTAKQAGEGLKILGQAGLNAKQSMEALPGILNLATIGELSLAEATETAISAVNAFRLPMAELGRINDVIGKTAVATNADVRDIAESFKYAAPAAAAFGYSLEEAAGYIGLLANLGIKGSMAGTQLTFAFTKVAEIFKSVGMDGEGKKLIDALNLINEKGMSTGQVMDIFGERGGRAVLGLQTLTGEYEDFVRVLEQAGGTAAEMAAIMRSDTTGSAKQMAAAFEGMKLDVFAKNQEAVAEGFKWLRDVINTVKDPVVETTGLFGMMAKAWIDFDRWFSTGIVNMKKGYDDVRRTQAAHWEDQRVGIDRVKQSMDDYDSSLKNVVRRYQEMSKFADQFEEVDEKLRESVGRWKKVITSDAWLISVGIDPKLDKGLRDAKELIDQVFVGDKETADKMKKYFTFRADAFGVSETDARKQYTKMIEIVKNAFPKEKHEQMIKFVQSQFETRFDIDFEPKVKAEKFPEHELKEMVKKWQETIRSFREQEMGLTTYSEVLKYQTGDVEKLKRIRALADKMYGGKIDLDVDVDLHLKDVKRGDAYADYAQRHKEVLGAYDAEEVKKQLKDIEEQWKEHDEGLEKLTKETFEAMRETVSDVYFKALEGDFKDFEDVYETFLKSIKKITADYFAQITMSSLFGKEGQGGGFLDDLLKEIGIKQNPTGLSDMFSGISSKVKSVFGFGEEEKPTDEGEPSEVRFLGKSSTAAEEVSSAMEAASSGLESAATEAVETIASGITDSFGEVGESLTENLATGLKESFGTALNVGVIYADSIVSTGMGEGGDGAGWLDAIMGAIGGSGGGGETETGMGTNTDFGGGSMTDYLGMVKHGGGSYSDPGSLKKPIQSFGPDEYMAILKKNEIVSTPEQIEAIGSSGPKSYFQVSNSILVQAPKGRITSESVNQLRTSISSEIALAQRRNG